MTATKWKAALAAALLVLVSLPSAEAGPTTRVVRRLWTNAAGDTTAMGMADSTAWIGTGQYQHLYLLLKPDRPCRVAIQIRTADSTTVDSTRWASWPWRSYVGAAGTLNNQTDSTTWKEVTAPLSHVGGEDEMVYEFLDFDATSGLKWYGPRGRYIPICKVDVGEWYCGPYTQIRVRVLNSMPVAGSTVKWSGSLIGVSW